MFDPAPMQQVQTETVPIQATFWTEQSYNPFQSYNQEINLDYEINNLNDTNWICQKNENQFDFNNQTEFEPINFSEQRVFNSEDFQNFEIQILNRGLSSMLLDDVNMQTLENVYQSLENFSG